MNGYLIWRGGEKIYPFVFATHGCMFFSPRGVDLYLAIRNAAPPGARRRMTGTYKILSPNSNGDADRCMPTPPARLDRIFFSSRLHLSPPLFPWKGFDDRDREGPFRPPAGGADRQAPRRRQQPRQPPRGEPTRALPLKSRGLPPCVNPLCTTTHSAIRILFSFAFFAFSPPGSWIPRDPLNPRKRVTKGLWGWRWKAQPALRRGLLSEVSLQRPLWREYAAPMVPRVPILPRTPPPTPNPKLLRTAGRPPIPSSLIQYFPSAGMWARQILQVLKLIPGSQSGSKSPSGGAWAHHWDE